jgi:hypothetical protein
MSGSRSRAREDTQSWLYETFAGLDTSRDATSLDTGRNQHLAKLENATCDWRGQIVRDPAAHHQSGEQMVHHVAFYETGRVVYVEQDGAGVNLRSDTGQTLIDAYPRDVAVSSRVFSRQVHFASRGSLMRYWDGASFQTNRSPAAALLRPSFMATVQRRLAVAGIPAAPTEVHISRVDNAQVFPGDEPDGELSVLRAGIIDVGNIIGTADKITGLAAYEQTRLVIFTADRAVVYEIDPDIDQWQLDASTNIRIGCVAHGTIANAGTDLLFCSRAGIHTIQRSEQNGILVDSLTLSDKVDLLYKRLYQSVEDPTHISAVWDADRGQYHVFFPQAGGQLCTRLTLALNPQGGDEGGGPAFSTGTFLNARCGAFLGGELVVGTPGGVWRIIPQEAEMPEGAVSPEMEVLTPLLWHGSLTSPKQTHSLTIQAAGRGVLEISAEDRHGQVLGSMRLEIDANSDDSDLTEVPLSEQYERQWQHRYVAARYRFKLLKSEGLVRLIGFAIKTRDI